MKIKKGNKEFIFDPKVLRNGNGVYRMAMKIQKENQKKTENKSTEKINAVAEKEQKLTYIFYMKNWGIHPKRW